MASYAPPLFVLPIFDSSVYVHQPVINYNDIQKLLKNFLPTTMTTGTETFTSVSIILSNNINSTVNNINNLTIGTFNTNVGMTIPTIIPSAITNTSGSISSLSSGVGLLNTLTINGDHNMTTSSNCSFNNMNLTNAIIRPVSLTLTGLIIANGITTTSTAINNIIGTGSQVIANLIAVPLTLSNVSLTTSNCIYPKTVCYGTMTITSAGVYTLSPNSYGISSIAKLAGTGAYSVTFTTTQANTNFIIFCDVSIVPALVPNYKPVINTITTSGFSIICATMNTSHASTNLPVGATINVFVQYNA